MTDEQRTPSGVADPDEQPDEQPAELRDQYADWPFGQDSDRPQPWDHRALEYDPSDVGPERDDVSPVVVGHSKPILTSGSAGEDVHELATLLADLGHPTSITEGSNPFNVLDGTVVQALASFRGEHGVQEDPAPFGGDTEEGRRTAAAHVGPYTWEALYRVRERESEED